MAIVDGPINVSFASLPYLKSRTPSQPNEVLLVIPQPGELGTLNHDLLALEGDGEQVRVITYEREVANRNEDFAMFDILIITSVLGLGGVFALMVGLLSLLYYMQRLSEFAVLQAIGYSKWFLLRRVGLESLGLTFAAWLMGLLLSEVILGVLLRFFLNPAIHLTVWDVRPILFTSPFPLMTGLSAAIAVGWSLGRLDPVTIIDRRG
jgi:ABC-type antimicrobial peptide transport system permease subunit